MSKKKRDLSGLIDIIGEVTKKHKEEIEIIKSSSQLQNLDNINNTSEFYIKSVRGIEFKTRIPKVIESFRIKQSLKKIVEEIVEESKSKKQQISKGEIYNYLIAKGLESL